MRCLLAQMFPPSGPCDGKLDSCHWIPKQVIKREVSDARIIVWDPRVVFPACRRHHGLFDNYFIRPSIGMLPKGLVEWCKEYGLTWRLVHDFKVEPTVMTAASSTEGRP